MGTLLWSQPAQEECASCIMSWLSFKDSLVSSSTDQVKSLNQSPEITTVALADQQTRLKQEKMKSRPTWSFISVFPILREYHS